ncbi:MAG TPA: hypothetical protein VFA50_00540 [Stellaceae bacterium]|nr:hypothetical protein [Stellaceae bacterium]
MPPRKEQIAQYRKKAKELRIDAKSISSARLRETMLKLADEYELVASKLQAIEALEDALKPPLKLN